MSGSALRVALVGAGGMARSYRGSYARLPGVEWALAVDLDQAELERSAAQGAQRCSRDFADALAPGIDVVEIATPNHLHAEQAVAALAAGKHVLLQKPMANTLEGARRILEAAATARGRLGMYLSSLTQPLAWEVRRLVADGALGTIQGFRTRDAHRGGLSARSDGWRASAERTGGGSFIQLAIHGIDLVQWWLQDPVATVAAMATNRLCPGIGGDDATVAIATTGGGVLGTFESGYASEGGARELFGTRGRLRLTGPGTLELVLDAAWESELLCYDTPGRPLTLAVEPRRLDDTTNPLHQQRQFIEAVREGREAPAPGARGWQALAVAVTAARAAAAATTLAVPPVPAPVAAAVGA